MERLRRLDPSICYFLILGGIASLIFPACRYNAEALPGWAVLAIGWMGLALLQTGWLGNILLLCIVVSSPDAKRAAAFQAGLLLFPISSALNWRGVEYGNGAYPIIDYGLGYYIWVTVMICALLLCLARCFYNKKTEILSA